MTEEQNINRGDLLALTVEIVAAHRSNNAVGQKDVASLIQTIWDTLSALPPTNRRCRTYPRGSDQAFRDG